MSFRTTTSHRKSRVFGFRPASERIVPDPPRVTRYQPTVFVDNDTLDRLERGWLKLQPGQWIQLAWCDKPSRWAGITPSGTVVVQHYKSYRRTGSSYPADTFRTLINFANHARRR
jgi:hypothetical protein